MDNRNLLQMTSEIVAAHASVNELTQAELLGEIELVFKKLAALGGGNQDQELEVSAEARTETPEAPPKPAVPMEAAFGADKVFCMVCGQGMKTLKRHISTAHGMKPGEYRRNFGVPAGTPLVAKNYSEARKKMAADLKLAGRLVKARAARGKKRGQ